MAKHTRPVMCQYEGCNITKASNKDLIRHAWNAHRIWAEEMGFDRIDGRCPHCERYFSRTDNLKQHLDGNKCKATSG